MNWIKKIFKTGKGNDEVPISREDDMLTKLESSINNCETEINKAEDEKEQIRKWAIEAIRGTFEVPKQFWYEELKMYQKIRSLEENNTVDKLVLKKCDEVIQGYLDEIKLRETKIKLYNSLIEKYGA